MNAETISNMSTNELSPVEIAKFLRLKEQRLKANRKFSQANKEKMKSAYKSWYEKNKNDPMWIEKKREREREGYQRRKELKALKTTKSEKETTDEII
jgi:hypothetical protein